MNHMLLPKGKFSVDFIFTASFTFMDADLQKADFIGVICPAFLCAILSWRVFTSMNLWVGTATPCDPSGNFSLSLGGVADSSF